MVSTTPKAWRGAGLIPTSGQHSLFKEWRSLYSNPQYVTTSDFAVDMAAELCSK
jgi:hypothetical protein